MTTIKNPHADESTAGRSGDPRAEWRAHPLRKTQIGFQADRLPEQPESLFVVFVFFISTAAQITPAVVIPSPLNLHQERRISGWSGPRTP
ncbi:MAG: hypothetical protein WCA27_20755 [Candidatus Sulfotelmatobacter sp.]